MKTATPTAVPATVKVKPYPGPKWEYKLMTLDGNIDTHAAAFNVVGAEGFELVTIQPGSDNVPKGSSPKAVPGVATFKRLVK